MKINRYTLIIIILLLVLLVGCKSNDIEQIQKNVESVNIEIVNISELENATYYSIDIINNGDELLKYVQVMLGYAVTDEAKNEGLIGPIMFNAKAVDSAIDIKPGDSKRFLVEIPTQLLKMDKLNSDKVQVFIEGYFSEVTIENRFQKNGGIGYFKAN